jgi:hypothetical protein
VKVRSGAAAGWGDVDPVKAVVAAGGLLIGQIVVGDSMRFVVRRRVGSLEPGADLRLVLRVAGLRIGRHDKGHIFSVAPGFRSADGIHHPVSSSETDTRRCRSTSWDLLLDATTFG